MRQVTKEMIALFQLRELGHDFMGYKLQKNDIYTFHHLIIPNRLNGPYEVWNGAILCGNTSHPYLHLIEAKDYELFLAITSELIDINVNGFIDKKNLKYIDNCLSTFEREYSGTRTRKGKVLIKPESTERVIK